MTADDDATERVRRIWDRHAARFDREMAFWERVLSPGDRAWACGQAEGDVLEVAVGTGRNLEHYPPQVDVVGIDLSDEMLALAMLALSGYRPNLPHSKPPDDPRKRQ